MDVALFVFRRPHLTSKVLDAIQVAQPSRLFIVADGPRPGNEEEARLVREVRAVVTTRLFLNCEVSMIFSEKNLGPRERFNSGLDIIFDRTDSCIILEDDCVPNPSFFGFCQELLEFHKENNEVGIISGFNFRNLSDDGGASYFFTHDAPIWGWATWARSWKAYSASSLRSQITEHDILACRGSFSSQAERFFAERLMKIENGKNWDIPFSVFLRSRGYKNVVTATNLVDNLGQDDGPSNYFLVGWDSPSSARAIGATLTHPKSFALDSAKEAQRWRRRFFGLVMFFLKRPRIFVRRLVLEVNFLQNAKQP